MRGWDVDVDGRVNRATFMLLVKDIEYCVLRNGMVEFELTSS